MHQPIARLASARLYLCTDARRDRGDLAEFADAALAGGVDIIQLRDKGSAAEHRLGPLEASDELAALEVHERFYEIGSPTGLNEMTNFLSRRGDARK